MDRQISAIVLFVIAAGLLLAGGYKITRHDGVRRMTFVVGVVLGVVGIFPLLLGLLILILPADPPHGTKPPPSVTDALPSEINLCAPSDADEFAAVPGGNAESNWAVISERTFPPGFWTVGQHTYTFWFEPCAYAGELPDHLSRSFVVTSEARRIDGSVYLGPLGLSISKDPYGPFVEAIHPSQSTMAVIEDIQLTRSEAEAFVRECVTWISWDGGEKQRLVPHKPCRYDVR